MNRTLPILVSAALAFGPGAAGVARAAFGADRVARSTTASAAAKRHHRKAVRRRFAGPAVGMQYGPVKATIIVRGKRIVKVRVKAPEDRPRSKAINRHAVPILVHETLRSQSVRGVHKVSGASLTTNAYLASLANAMAKAHLPGA